MWLARRVVQPEYTDTPGLSLADVQANYRQLRRINELLWVTDPFIRLMPNWLGEDQCRHLTILDLGAGDGSVGRALEDEAARRGWAWAVTSLDQNPTALRLNAGRASVCGSVVALPFCDNAFDVVIASQMTHHLDTANEVVRHFAEAWRVSRRAILLSDVHRNAGLYGFMAVLLRALRMDRRFVKDGLISVRRAWRVPEWRRMADEAGIQNARVWLYYGSRLILQARKAASFSPGLSTSETSATYRGPG